MNSPDVGSPDTTRPRVSRTVPTSGATGLGPNANAKATFSEDMKASTINGQTFELFKHGSTTKVGAVVSYDASKDRAKLDPNNPLKRGVTYKAVVTTSATDEAGNRLDQRPGVSGLQQKSWTFTISN
ncbi:MAG: Ig-like domain-containing protein [Rubrobacteraceae bacterium]